MVESRLADPDGPLAVATQSVVVGQDRASKARVVPEAPAAQVVPEFVDVRTTPSVPTAMHVVAPVHFTTSSVCTVEAGRSFQLAPSVVEVNTAPSAPTATHNVVLGHATESNDCVVTAFAAVHVCPPSVVYLVAPPPPTIVHLDAVAQAMASGVNGGSTVTSPVTVDDAKVGSAFPL